MGYHKSCRLKTLEYLWDQFFSLITHEDRFWVFIQTIQNLIFLYVLQAEDPKISLGYFVLFSSPLTPPGQLFLFNYENKDIFVLAWGICFLPMAPKDKIWFNKYENPGYRVFAFPLYHDPRIKKQKNNWQLKENHCFSESEKSRNVSYFKSCKLKTPEIFETKLFSLFSSLHAILPN